jgi:hypothetical protein
MDQRAIEKFLDNEWVTNLSPQNPKEIVVDKQLLRATALGYFTEVEITLKTPQLQTESRKPLSLVASRSLANVKSRDRLGTPFQIPSPNSPVGEDLILRNLSLALNIGVQLKEDWIILNSSIFLYNYYSHLFKAQQYSNSIVALYERAVATYQEIFTALSQHVTANRNNVMVLLTLCDGFACMLEQFYYLKKRAPPTGVLASSATNSPSVPK